MSSNAPKCTSCQKCDDTHIAIPNNLLSVCPSAMQKCEACVRVKNLTTEVEEAAEKLKKLIEVLQRAKTEMNHHHSSVVSKLPPEILSTIFEVYTSDALPPRLQDEIHFEVPQHNTLPIPLVLSHVCHRWRQVAFSTPQIWTTFTISLDRCDGSPAEQDIVSAWISRTRNHPLTIHLHSSLEEDYHTEDWEKLPHLPVLRVLASSSRQWRHFSTRVPKNVLDYLGMLVYDIPLIDTVGIRLRALQMYIMYGDPIAHRHVGRLWWAVTTMRIEHVSTEQCLSLISSSPNLVTCNFEDINTGSFQAWFHSGQPVIEHPKMQHFTYNSRECCHLFYRLKLPNLRSLTCDGEGFAEDWSTILPVFFANSGLEKLELFRLPDGTFTFDQFKSLLSLTPTITHLLLVCICQSMDVVEGLLEHLDRTAIIDSSQSPLAFLPNLTSLEFEVHKPFFPWDLVPPSFAHVLAPKSATELNYRPLSSFKVVDQTNYSDHNDSFVTVPPKGLEDLITIIQKGVEIKFLDKNGYDLLKEALEIARMYSQLDIYLSCVQDNE